MNSHRVLLWFLKCTCVVLDCTYSVTCFVFPLWYVFILSHHVDKYKSCSFILIAILQIHAYEYVGFIHSPINEYWSCCKYFGINSNALMNICVPVSLAYLREFLCLPNGELLGYTHIFSLLETAKYFFNLHNY